MGRIAVVTLAVVLIGCSSPRAKLPVDCEPPPSPSPHQDVVACDEAVNAALGSLPADVSVRHAFFSFGACAPFMYCPPQLGQPNFGKVVFETDDPAMRLVWVAIATAEDGTLVSHYQGEWLEDAGVPDID